MAQTPKEKSVDTIVGAIQVAQWALGTIGRPDPQIHDAGDPCWPPYFRVQFALSDLGRACEGFRELGEKGYVEEENNTG